MASGTRKAAMLLKALDSKTAGDLLRLTDPKVMTEIAAEMAYLESSGVDGAQAGAAVREFAEQLGGSGSAPKFQANGVRLLLEGAVGQQKSKEMMGQVQTLMESRDPFAPIRKADVDDLAEAMEGESPAVVGMVMSELPAAKSAALLNKVSDEVRMAAIQGMTMAGEVAHSTKVKVANLVRNRLIAKAQEALKKSGPRAGGGSPTANAKRNDGRKVQLRKVALLLRGMAQEVRDKLVKAVADQDKETGAMVMALMVTWDDVATVGERSMQEALRGVDSRKMALALVGAESGVTNKIRSCISERARSMIDEEASLLNKPKAEDIEKSREDILNSLREMNAKGTLAFEEE